MTTVAIIGSGFGGLCMAIRLQQAGISYTIFEKSDRLGGTWRDNHYPGAACDVPSHLYSYSFEPKPDWSRKFGEQAEILAYLQHCADKYQVRSHIRFGVEVARAEFVEAAAEWTLHDSAGGQHRARVLVSACGQLNRPALPLLPGLASFGGEQFHSARWNHHYDLGGKRVAVIGCGASAIQFVPHVAERAGKLSLFQRSPPWIVPKPDRAYSGLGKSLLRWVPGLLKLSRAGDYWLNEARFTAFRPGGRIHALAEGLARKHLERSVADPALRAALTPDYPLGCKRLLISNDYYPALQRDHVELVTSAITQVEPGALLTADGRRHPADAIIFGTGFRSTDFLSPMSIAGRDGADLNQRWRDGAEAYLGISVTGFPNLFILYGPNTNLGHNSIIFMLESQVRYVMGCLRALERRKLRFLDLRPEVQRAYNQEMQQRLGQSIWATGCSNWYLRDGRNINNWPGFTVEYRRRTRRPNLDHYQTT